MSSGHVETMQMHSNASFPALSTPSSRPRVIVFGATGGTGRLLVEQALARGYAVTAFSRNPGKLELEHPALTKVAGDVLDPASVEAAVAGHDAVVVTLGMPLLDRSGLRAKGTANVVRAMEAVGVERLICLSIMGLGESWDNLPWLYKRFMIPVLLARPTADHRDQEQLILASELDWTIVRPPNMTDKPGTGEIRHGFGGGEGPVGMYIPRADVAAFMLDQLDGDDYHRAAVGVTAS